MRKRECVWERESAFEKVRVCDIDSMDVWDRLGISRY